MHNIVLTGYGTERLSQYWWYFYHVLHHYLTWNGQYYISRKTIMFIVRQAAIERGQGFYNTEL